ncbi:hypothetical protein GSI_01434 [Ganoderma sinense ZZ0214-1]|uniref:Uncharacterized protein n=1 Tax=Ganoderma sinense ZZ0214-1 TaxID=1077348 RepID=A0A2G8SVG0_9APHY|nr:hypothetical protein GSI_01434 [Ganoderma sinense ZZ0214-1]
MPVFSKISSKTASATSCLSSVAPKAKAKVGPRLPRGATVVTGIKLSVTVATKLDLSVPYMQGISEAADEIMKYSDAVKTNRKQCKRLAAVCEELMGALLAATEGVEERDLEIPVSLSLAELEWQMQSPLT